METVWERPNSSNEHVDGGQALPRAFRFDELARMILPKGLAGEEKFDTLPVRAHPIQGVRPAFPGVL